MAKKGDDAKSRELARQVRERALLYEIEHDINGVIDLDELLAIIMDRTKEAFGVESSAILLIDRETSELYFPHVSDVDADVERRIESARVPPGQGIAGWVIEHDATACVADVRSDPRWYGKIDDKSGMKSESLLCTPLRGRGTVLGVISLRNKLAGEFDEGDIRLVESVAVALGAALESSIRFEDTQRSEARLRDELNRRDARDNSFRDLVGRSEPMREVFRLMESAIAAPITVMIRGESGTGKELVARAIHSASPRRDKSFVVVNCAGLSEGLLDSELFGHRKGSFTHAFSDRPGLFEVADKGTLFLDEVGDMPSAMQIKLLRALQEGEVVRVGESEPRRVDVRVISATHIDLDAAVRDGRFREDLYYRLNTFPIRVPPLRERKADIPLIAVRLLEDIACEYGREGLSFAPEVLASFEADDWSSNNVRELGNEIERAVAIAIGCSRIEPEHLSERFRSVAPRIAPPALETGALTLKEARELFEKEYVSQVLGQHRGNATQAARTLGVSRVTLQKMIKRYRLRERC